MTARRCGHPVRRYEIPGHPVLGEPECGRRPGHPGRHISVEALRRRRSQAPSGSHAIAAAIQGARKRAGLTQVRLAVLAGVTEQCVQRWEQAERTPGPESWVQLELTLGPLGVVREAGPGTEAATKEGQERAA